MSFNKAYTTTTFALFSYGFSRGYRCQEYKQEHHSVKISAGIVNSTAYVVPVLNFYPIWNLMNRITVNYFNLDQNKHKDNYKELVGICYDTC